MPAPLLSPLSLAGQVLHVTDGKVPGFSPNTAQFEAEQAS